MDGKEAKHETPASMGMPSLRIYLEVEENQAHGKSIGRSVCRILREHRKDLENIASIREETVRVKVCDI